MKRIVIMSEEASDFDLGVEHTLWKLRKRLEGKDDPIRIALATKNFLDEEAGELNERGRDGIH